MLTRVIVHGFPAKSPKAAVLVDVDTRDVSTFVGAELAGVAARILGYDVIAGVDIRAFLRALAVDPGDRRLAELAPPQKTIQVNRAGRTIKITTAMLISSSCAIRRPLGDEKKLRGYLAKGQDAQLRRQLEADGRALFALHAYGRLHGGVRLRLGVLDEMFPAPWLHRDEPMFYNMMREARSLGLAIEAVVGSAPDWDQPWSRAERLEVEQGAYEYDVVLIDKDGEMVDERDVQLARLELVIN